ncbi:MAG: ATP-grasp domain-containing protein [Treponema sp.]|nr:ATP-grasp domain-containing protein [Treponema sp.]
MESKSVLILGAGLMQKPAIESAKELGLKVFVIDANPDAVCTGLADVFKQIDLKNKEEIADYAVELKEKHNLKAVFTAGTDFSASVAYASEKAGLLSHTYQASMNASDKVLMRKCFKEACVPSPEFIQIHRSKICEVLTKEYVQTFSYPMVVKPTDNMGARGCRMIRSNDELLYSVEEAVKNSRSGNCILESYMEGPEFSIDALVYDGTMTITGFADRHIYFPPYFIETGHTMPTKIEKRKYDELIKTFADGVKALGLTRGAAKADIKYTHQGAMIGEIAARLSGGYMSGWTYPYSSDFNLTKAALQIAMGDTPDELEKNRIPLDIESPFKLFTVESKKVSAERAWISIPGKIKKIIGLDQKCDENIIRNILPRCKEGDAVTFPRNNVEKCGNIISVSEDYETAVKSCEGFIKNIVIELEKNNPVTTNFLEGKKLKQEKKFPPNAFNLSGGVLKLLEVELKKKDEYIPEGENVLNYIPEILNKPEILELKDWNHLTLKESLEKFNILKKGHKRIEYRKFWLYLIRGGIQGALYCA